MGAKRQSVSGRIDPGEYLAVGGLTIIDRDGDLVITDGAEDGPIVAIRPCAGGRFRFVALATLAAPVHIDRAPAVLPWEPRVDPPRILPPRRRPPHAPAGEPPLVSYGQGATRKDIYPKDLQ